MLTPGYERQEPGRNLVGTGVLAPGPQFQPNSVWLLPGENVAVAVPVDIGTRRTSEPLTEVLMLVTVAVTTPLPSVLMACTYLEPVPALTSQPQLLGPGAEPPDWYTSVIEVRQALMARITSDIFARMV